MLKCWCGAEAESVSPCDPLVSTPSASMSDGLPGVLTCWEHARDGYEMIPVSVEDANAEVRAMVAERGE